jgi:hypothetical protein
MHLAQCTTHTNVLRSLTGEEIGVFSHSILTSASLATKPIGSPSTNPEKREQDRDIPPAINIVPAHGPVAASFHNWVLFLFFYLDHLPATVKATARANTVW